MGIQQTSLLSYKALTPLKLGNRQQQVYEAIENNAPVTDKELSELTGLPINVITPRRGELAKKNLIKVAYVKVADNGRPALYWKLRDPNFPAMRELRAARREAE